MPAELEPVDPAILAALARLVAVMHLLRRESAWDANQTHASLAHYLVEEAGEVIDAIEVGTPADLREELGDLLLQVVFHAEIAAGEGHFNLADVASGIADKLLRRKGLFLSAGDTAADVEQTWEQRKRAEKQRQSALDGIPDALHSLARAHKVVSRARAHDRDLGLPSEPISAEEAGAAILAVVARAQASGVDPDQACRAAVRALETAIRAAE